MPKNSSHQPRLISDPGSEYKITLEEQAQKDEYYQRLQKYLQDPDFRKIPGFPIGEDEAILELSDPPFFTACPNPFLAEIIEQWKNERVEVRKELGLPENNGGQNRYHRQPLASDVSAGKNDAIYSIHSYPTKIPPKAIVPYILHYTDPSDIVLDAFCGTGMMGIASTLCDNKEILEELGYTVAKNGDVSKDNDLVSKKGKRFSILSDLSPMASFIAYNYNTPVDSNLFNKLAKKILHEIEEECKWMYETWHPNSKSPSRKKGEIIYTVWSDVFICPECDTEMVYWDVAINLNKKEVKESWHCPNCKTLLSKKSSKKTGAMQIIRATETIFDALINATRTQIKEVPVLISYKVGKHRVAKRPDEEDLLVLEKIKNSTIRYKVPNYPMLFKGENWGDSWRAGYHTGITHAHHFYTKRNLWILSAIIHRITRINASDRVKKYLIVWFTSSQSRLHRMNRYMAKHNRHVGPLSGTLYISSTMAEISPFYFANAKLSDHVNIHPNNKKLCISTQSATSLFFSSDNSVDYIYTDPPFGGNLMYSELNFLLEFWLNVFTNNKPEAIVSEVQNKTLFSYQQLMEKNFHEYFRVLKPGRWITVVFHNSQHSVWNSIQESLLRAGFVVADVRTLDKKKGTTKQLSSVSIVKQDLVISAYKPQKSFEEKIKATLGDELGVWEFVRQHLFQLPVVIKKGDLIEINPERQPFLLFDRLVAFHIQRGARVPLSAGKFYIELPQKFIERDGMIFLPDQAHIYDKERINSNKLSQYALFITDEKSAIIWLRQNLDQKLNGYPQTSQEIQPILLKKLNH